MPIGISLADPKTRFFFCVYFLIVKDGRCMRYGRIPIMYIQMNKDDVQIIRTESW